MARNRKISRTINAEPEAFELARAVLRLKLIECEKNADSAPTDEGKRQWRVHVANLRLILAQLN